MRMIPSAFTLEELPGHRHTRPWTGVEVSQGTQYEVVKEKEKGSGAWEGVG